MFEPVIEVIRTVVMSESERGGFVRPGPRTTAPHPERLSYLPSAAPVGPGAAVAFLAGTRARSRGPVAP